MIVRLFAAALLGASVLGASQASALTIRVMKGSAIGMPSTFNRAGDAPRSTFEKAQQQSELQSVFVPAEVAPERVEATRALLSELDARRSGGDIVVDLPADVLFDFDKAVLRPDAEPALAKAAQLLGSYPTAIVTIAGHTDSKGDDAYNDALSERRAKAVADRLSTPSRQLDARGFGERQPVAANQRPDGADDPQGRQKNRRVEIRIKPNAD